MKKYDKDLIEDFIEVIKQDHDVYSYSGRSMFGKKCLAFTISKEDSEAGVVADIMSSFAEDFEADKLIDISNFFHGSKTDSMGHDTVMYFPSIEWQEEWNDEE